MKNNKFLNFIKFPFSHKKMINEDLVALYNEKYSSITLQDLLDVAVYSNEWDDSMSNCTLKLEFDTDELDKKRENIQKLNDAFPNKTASIDDTSQPIHIMIQSSNDKELYIKIDQKKIGLLGKTLSQLKLRPSGKPKRTVDGIIYSGNDLLLKNIYIVQKIINNDEDISKIALLSGSDKLSDADQTAFQKMVTLSKTILEIKCINLRAALVAYNAIYNGKIDITINETKLSKDQRQDFYSHLTLLENIPNQLKFIFNIAFNELRTKNITQILKEFEDFNIARKIKMYYIAKNLEFDDIIDDENYELINSNKEQLSKTTIDKRRKDFNEKVANSIFQIKTLDELKAQIDKSSDNSLSNAEFEKKYLKFDVKPTNPCAARRMKLFADIQRIDTHKPAAVFTSRHWVVAITYTAAQNHVFGRYKPVVDDDNNIIQKYNLCDDEGISKDDAKIRDATESKHINDGLPGVPASQIYESNWCTTGGDPFGGQGASAWKMTHTVSYWNNYGGPTHGMCIIMNVKTGQLYQYGRHVNGSLAGFLYEQEHNAVGLTAEGGSGETLIKNVKANHPDLAVLLNRVERIWNITTNDSNNNEIENYIKRYNLLTKNNRLIIRSADDFNKLRPMFSTIDGIILAREAVNTEYSRRSLFVNKHFDSLPVIDCINVKDASEMFMGVEIGTIEADGQLVLKNTHNITNMARMFRDCRVSKIAGLNTRSAIDMSYIMFSAANLKMTQFIDLPEFDLRSCAKLDYAFTHCASRKISVVNATDKLKSAINAFVDCYALEKIPQIVNIDKSAKTATKVFSGINDFGSLRVFSLGRNGEKNAQHIFDGCLVLQKTSDFESICEYIDTAYNITANDTTSDAKTDSRGFIVIKSRNDVYKYCANFDKYPGVYVDVTDATQLFAENDIRIKKLDLSNVRIATQMFTSSTIYRLDEIIGLNNVNTADRMFNQCKCNIYPDLDFSGLCGRFTVFYGAHSPKGIKLPKVTLGKMVTLGFNELYLQLRASKNDMSDAAFDEYYLERCGNIAQSVCFGYDAYSEWCKVNHKTRVNMWIKDLQAQVEKFILNSVKMDDPGNITEKGYIKIANNLQAAIIISTPDNISKCKGLYIDTSDATDIFSKIHCNDKITLPPIDMEKVENATRMFSTFYGKLSAFENTDHIKIANNMFENAVVNVIPEMSVKQIINANNMFLNVKTDNDYSLPNSMKSWDALVNATSMFSAPNTREQRSNLYTINLDEFKFNHLQNADYIFKNCKIKASNIKFNSVVSAIGMFSNAVITSNTSNFVNIELPAATNCTECFKYAVFNEHGIGKCLLPVTRSTNQCFYTCDTLEYIGHLNISQARNINAIFKYCSNLKLIAVRKFPRGTYFDSFNAFKGCKLHNIYGNNAEKIKIKNRVLNRM